MKKDLNNEIEGLFALKLGIRILNPHKNLWVYWIFFRFFGFFRFFRDFLNFFRIFLGFTRIL